MCYQLYLSQAALKQTVLLSISNNGETKKELALILQYRMQWIQERHLHGLSYHIVTMAAICTLIFHIQKKDMFKSYHRNQCPYWK